MSGSGWSSQDRKSVVEGKRVDFGGRRIIKKKKRSESRSARLSGVYAHYVCREPCSCWVLRARMAPRSMAQDDGPAHRRARLRFFFQAEDGIRDVAVTGVQTCALPI